MNQLRIKKSIKDIIFKKLSHFENIISVTLVGSFVDKQNLDGISDIDTVVICRNLTKNFFNDCKKVIGEIDVGTLGLEGYSLRINDTFGPLKFNGSNLVVIHLMVYDVKGHIQHTVKSPFTCFEWERSKAYQGLMLKQIHPVGLLQPRDFQEVRRSLSNYIEDLNKGSISFRTYEFSSKRVMEKLAYKELDRKHLGEYAFHIYKNIVMNYLKLIARKNIKIDHFKVKEFLKSLKSQYDYVSEYDSLMSIKIQKKDNFSFKSKEIVNDFITQFSLKIKNDWKYAHKIIFLRHHKTRLNNGIFLGQKLNPGIINKTKLFKIKQEKVKFVYSSPLKRSMETAKIYFKETKIISDPLLLEIDYGESEGLDFNDLKKQYPHLIDEWKKGKDCKFPKGENYKNVLNRVLSFTRQLSKSMIHNDKSTVLIVTHNCVLRSIVGHFFNFDVKIWHKLDIPHGIPLEFLLFNQKYYPNIERKTLGQIFKKLNESVS